MFRQTILPQTLSGNFSGSRREYMKYGARITMQFNRNVVTAIAREPGASEADTRAIYNSIVANQVVCAFGFQSG